MKHVIFFIFQPIFGYIIDNKPNITGKQICGIIMETANCPNAENVKWTIDIPTGNTIPKQKVSYFLN